MIELTAVDIGVFSLDAEDVLCVLLVGDANVNVLAEVCHSLSRFCAGPELSAVVKVAGDLYALCLCRLASITADINEILAERGCDTGEVEPIGTLENGIPIEIGGAGFLNCRVSSVVYTNGASLRCALLKIVDTDSVAAADDL